MKLLGFIASFLLVAATASAQTPSIDRPISTAMEASVAALAQAPAPVNGGTRDSVKEGLVIGAVAGGVAAGLFGTVLCHALKEPGDPSCWTGVLTIGALGAGIGAAAGAGIDALLSESSPRRVRDRQRWPGGRAVALTWRQRF